jgi:predicted MFS family arabinose efflux permease
MGLFMAAPFAGGPHWRWAFLAHGGLYAVLLLFAGWLPARAARRPGTKSNTPWAIFRCVPVLRLGASYGVNVIMGLGVNIVLTLYFATVHHASLALAASLLAGANFVSIPGGLLAGMVLARGVTARTVSIGSGIVSVAAAIFLFAPWVSLGVAVAAMVVWLLAFAMFIAVVNTLIPRVMPDAESAAATAGLVHQFAGVGGFLAPVVMFAAYRSHEWTSFMAIIIVGWAACLALMPIWRRVARPVAAPGPA